MKILGSGGHAKVVAQLADSLGITINGMLGKEECTREVEGVTIPDSIDSPLFIAIGDNKRRSIIGKNLEADYPVLISPAAYVSPTALIGGGTAIMPMAGVQADATIGRHAIVNTGAIVEHDCRVGDFAHISPGAVLCGGVNIGEGAWIGAGAVVLPGVEVGAWAIVGAGTTVLANVPASTTAVGLWKSGAIENRSSNSSTGVTPK
ncbi:MAG: acetyltransferase [Clostridium sp.]|nr:acetyltransferase [Prevotella sp.]MCM1429078.1 acetyltransferase [Clostridium sp.]MCM1475391.1 acetyltransferase [Muribaculaceae bacterium]